MSFNFATFCILHFATFRKLAYLFQYILHITYITKTGLEHRDGTAPKFIYFFYRHAHELLEEIALQVQILKVKRKENNL